MKLTLAKPKRDGIISKTRMAKLITLAVFGIIPGLAISNLILKFATNPSLSTSIWLLIWIIILPLVVSLYSVLITKQKIITVFVAISTIALLSFLFTKTSPLVLLITFMVTAILLWIATHAGKKVYENMIVFQWLHMSPYVIKPTFTTMAIFLTVAYMAAIPIEDTDFTKPIFTNAINYTGTYLSMAAPNTTWDSTVQDFALNIAALRGATFTNDQEKEKIIEESIATLNKSINEKFKTNFILEPKETLKDTSFRLIDGAIRNIDKNTSYIIIFGLGAIIFLTLFYTFKFLSIFTVLLGYIFFKLLGLTKFYSIDLEDKKKEVLQM